MTDITVHQALVHVMRDVTHVAKTEKNQQQHFNFRGIDGVLNAVGPALRAHGVIVVPHEVSIDRDIVEVGKNRTRMASVHVDATFRFYGPAGDHLDAQVHAESMDAGDKATAKAMSVALRTCLLQTLALPTHEPDPDHDVYERSAGEDHETLLGRVNDLMLQLEKAKVEHDPAKIAEFATQGPVQAQKTIARLTKMLP